MEAEPGIAVILCTGGTVDDRWLAEVVTREELAACGIRQAKFSFDSSDPEPIAGVEGDWNSPGWQPGEYGKGVISPDGQVYHWSVGQYSDGVPWHDHVISSLGLAGASRFRLNPDGSFTHYAFSQDMPPEEMNHYISMIPGTTRHVPWGEEYADSLWEDSHTSSVKTGQFTWTPGQYGKGILTDDGVLHAWGVGENNDGDPIHNAMARRIYPDVGFQEEFPSHTRFWLDPRGNTYLYTNPTYVKHEPEEVMRHMRQHVPTSEMMGAHYPYRDEWLDDSLWESDDDGRSATSATSQESQFGNLPRQTSIQKTASWADIMAKAKRLIQSGNVTLLRNGYNVVVAHVIGDHGEYQVEISRDDPDSRAITQWTCECPWDQYAFQRTRQWKKYEGRPCAHVLAAYWKSLGTPLDEDAPPGATPSGPAVPQEPQGMAPTSPFQPRIPVQGQPGPDGGMMPPLPPSAQMTGPALPPPSPLPPVGGVPPMGQYFQPPSDPSIIPPYPMDPAQLQLPVSTPGARGGPYPANPMQQPGTFSKVATVQIQEHHGEPVEDNEIEPYSQAMIYDADANTLHVGSSDDVYHNDIWPYVPNRDRGYPGFISNRRKGYQWYKEMPPEIHAPLHATLSQYLGYEPVDMDTAPPEYEDELWHESKVATEDFYYHIAPTEERRRILQWGLQPSYPGHSENFRQKLPGEPTGIYVTPSSEDADATKGLYWKEGEPRPMDVWRIPRAQVREVRRDPKHSWAYIIPHAVPAQLHLPFEQTLEKWSTLAFVYKVAGSNDEFPPQSAARLNEATLGQSEGREGATDAGQWMEVPRNARVEVVYQDPATGWVEVTYPLKGGPMTSYHIRCFVEPEKLTPLPGVDSPMAPRRRT